MPTETFADIALDELRPLAEQRKADGWRCVQLMGINTDDGVDVLYSFEKDGNVDNFTIKGVKKGTKVPSISDLFFQVFVFENEAHDLFGVEIEGIVIDFGGKFYDVTMEAPMTYITPEQKAAKEKAAKAAAAKAAKEAAAKADKPAAAPADDLEAKLAGMDPEKAAKVRAAMEAKKKREQEKGE